MMLFLEESQMSNEKKPEKTQDDQDQDLNWQKQAETENIQKSVNPDSEYMKDHGLCQKCHGAKKRCDRDGCPQQRPA